MKQLNFRCDDAEKEAWDAACGGNLSVWIRKALNKAAGYTGPSTAGQWTGGEVKTSQKPVSAQKKAHPEKKEAKRTPIRVMGHLPRPETPPPMGSSYRGPIVPFDFSRVPLAKPSSRAELMGKPQVKPQKKGK